MQFESFWTRHSWVLTVVVVVVVSSLGVLLDFLLVDEGVSRREMLIISNTLTGLVAGWLIHSFTTYERNRRALMRERMQTVAELNHHIRNALQVIKFWGGTQSNVDALQLQLINESVERIEWAMREILPRYPIGAPGKTSQAAQSTFPPVTSNFQDDLIQQRKSADPH